MYCIAILLLIKACDNWLDNKQCTPQKTKTTPHWRVNSFINTNVYSFIPFFRSDFSQCMILIFFLLFLLYSSPRSDRRRTFRGNDIKNRGWNERTTWDGKSACREWVHLFRGTKRKNIMMCLFKDKERKSCVCLEVKKEKIMNCTVNSIKEWCGKIIMWKNYYVV